MLFDHFDFMCIERFNFFYILVTYTDMWYILHKEVNNDENISILLLAR